MSSPTDLDLFMDLERGLIEERNVREALVEDVRNLEQAARQISTIMQSIHQKTTSDQTSAFCAKSREVFIIVKKSFKSIAGKIPEGEYYKHVSQWQSASTRLCFLASLVIYIEDGTLATREKVMDMLGVEVDRKNGFHIDLEDYLCGLLSLASELSRLAVNSVIAGDYIRPLKISKFVCNLKAGFRLLNLKNDYLRKKYDGLKYDVKKIEQVVYDLKIRGLGAAEDEDGVN